jgi:hypothetical protein
VINSRVINYSEVGTNPSSQQHEDEKENHTKIESDVNWQRQLSDTTLLKLFLRQATLTVKDACCCHSSCVKNGNSLCCNLDRYVCFQYSHSILWEGVLSSIGRLDKYVLGKSVNNALAILI